MENEKCQIYIGLDAYVCGSGLAVGPPLHRNKKAAIENGGLEE